MTVRLRVDIFFFLFECGSNDGSLISNHEIALIWLIQKKKETEKNLNGSKNARRFALDEFSPVKCDRKEFGFILSRFARVFFEQMLLMFLLVPAKGLTSNII